MKDLHQVPNLYSGKNAINLRLDMLKLFREEAYIFQMDHLPGILPNRVMLHYFSGGHWIHLNLPSNRF